MAAMQGSGQGEGFRQPRFPNIILFMSFAIPKTTGAELQERLSELAASQTLNEVALARLKVDAEKLMPIDAGAAHTVLGGIAALQWRQGELDDHHRIVIGLGDTALAHNNYAISLQLAQRRDDAADQALIASEKDPLDLEYSRRAIRYLATAGRIEDAMTQLRQFTERFSSEPLLDVLNVPDIQAAMTQFCVSEDELRVCQREAFALLREKKIRASYINFEAMDSPDTGMIIFAIRVPGSLKQMMELDAELGERLFQVWPEPSLNRFWIGFERDYDA